MEGIIKFNLTKDYIIDLRGEKVILDSDVAVLYGMETREINQAVRNNPAKFPDGYVFEISKSVADDLQSKNLITINPMSRVLPQSLHRKRPVHACHHLEGRAGDAEHHCHY